MLIIDVSIVLQNGFAINERTGEITTTLPFNRDAVSYISFRVVATDMNADKPTVQRGFSKSSICARGRGGIRDFTSLLVNYPHFLFQLLIRSVIHL